MDLDEIDEDKKLFVGEALEVSTGNGCGKLNGSGYGQRC